jgi:hypothetical protein
MDNDALVSLVNTFLPGVAIVLGTYFSLTLSILYNRFSQIQQTVTSEASLLALCCRNLLDMLCSNDIRKDCDKTAVQAAQCIADQVRTLVRDSRGRETMMVIYSDPYTRLLQIVAECRNEGIKLDEVGENDKLQSWYSCFAGNHLTISHTLVLSTGPGSKRPEQRCRFM